MFGIGTGELLLLLVLALLVLGPERMPKLARDVGKTMADLRKTSDELRTEFLSADKALNAERLLDVATRVAAPTPETGKAAEMGATYGEPVAEAQASAPPDVPSTSGAPADPPNATQAEAVTGPDVVPPSDVPAIVQQPDETEFDREARLARERLEDPERMKEHNERAKAEGWTVPTDEAGTSPREG